jgi:hypothetical protein
MKRENKKEEFLRNNQKILWKDDTFGFGAGTGCVDGTGAGTYDGFAGECKDGNGFGINVGFCDGGDESHMQRFAVEQTTPLS